MLPKPLHVANEGLAFLLELVALVLLAVWGFRTGSNVAVHVLLGLGAPALMVVVWGAFAAPRAGFSCRWPAYWRSRPLSSPPRRSPATPPAGTRSRSPSASWRY
ncbi:YrdB family protein [Catenulispora yoronensis]